MLLFNQEQLVSRAIDSILAQETNYTYEIIVGDDASTDNTRKIVEKYQEKYPDIIKLNKYHPNYGILRNYQECLSRCTGDFLMGCSGDDWWHNRHKLQLQVDYLKGNPDCVLHYGGFVEYYPASGVSIEKKPIRTSKPLFESVLFCNPICALTACIRMDAMRQVDYHSFQHEGFLVEDWPKWISLSLMGTFEYTDEALATYSVYLGSAHHCLSYERRLEYIENFYKMRIYFARKAGKYEQLSSMIEDLYRTQCGDTAIQYGKQRDAIVAFKSVRKMNKKIRLKLILCYFNFTFKYISKRYNRNF